MGEVAGGDRILLLLMDAVIYAHVTPGMQKEAALRFEAALKQAEDENKERKSFLLPTPQHQLWQQD
jgi:hypothetical protein